MEVVESEMAVRGDTATGVTKKVITETGLTVQVPGFVEVGMRSGLIPALEAMSREFRYPP